MYGYMSERGPCELKHASMHTLQIYSSIKKSQLCWCCRREACVKMCVECVLRRTNVILTVKYHHVSGHKAWMCEDPGVCVARR